MSYILEALKKAEQKREQEEPSRVPMFLTGVVRGSGQRVRWPYVLAAALLLNAGLVVWHFIPRQTPSVSPSIVAQARTEPVAVARVPAKEMKKPVRSAASPKEPAELVASAKPVKPPSLPEAAPGQQARVDKPQAMPAGRAASVNELSEATQSPQVRVDKPRPVSPGKLFALNDLPPAIRGALPEFKVSGHAYTPEPQTRVVRINEKIDRKSVV
jgi:general secretion pathway protein B